MADRTAENRPPTIGNVARRAGVSPATVSRVINDRPNVRPAVRAKVQQTMRRLGYRPDQVARGLVRRETRTLGLMTPDLPNPFGAETATAILETARGHGYSVVLCNIDNLPRLQEESVEVLLRRRVDGILIGSAFLDDPVVEKLLDTRVPCMMYSRRLRSGRGNYVVLDNVKAGYDLTRHLLTLGHRRIGFVGSRPELSTASERLQGYRQALAEAGLPADPELVRPSATKSEIAYQMAVDLLKAPDRPTAIVARTDLIALSVMEAAADLGMRVPGDLAVVGVDDIRIAAHRRIQLTTVSQQRAEMGQLAVSWLLEIIRDPDRFARTPFQHVLAPTLIVRGSCGALPGSVLNAVPSGEKRELLSAPNLIAMADATGAGVPAGRHPRS